MLCWHVDYWDYIGWKDPFARPEFSERQRKYRKLRKLKTMGTPQVFIQNTDVPWEKGWLESVPGRVEKAAKTDATLAIHARAYLHDGKKIRVSVSVRQLDEKAKLPTDSVAVVPVLYRKHAKTPVRKGENEGKTLEEWHIALEAHAPLSIANALDEAVFATFELPKGAHPSDLGVAVLVEDEVTLRTLECVAVPVTVPIK